jgi:hypothetical protein
VLLHFGLESDPFHPEFGGRAGGPTDDLLGRLERAYSGLGRAVHRQRVLCLVLCAVNRPPVASPPTPPSPSRGEGLGGGEMTAYSP